MTDRRGKSKNRRPLSSLGIALLLCCPAPWGEAGPWAQRDSAATEAEWTSESQSLLRGDPHRDGDLWHLGSMDSVLAGEANISGFLSAWREVLSGQRIFQADSAETVPLEVMHFGGSHVQAGRIGWAFRNRMAEDRPGLVIGKGILAPYRLGGSNGPPERGWSSDADWKLQSCAHRRHTGQWGLTGVELRNACPEDIRCWSGAPAGTPCSGVFRLFAPPEDLQHWHVTAEGSLGPESAMDSISTGEWRFADFGGAPDTLVLRPDSGHCVLHGVEWRAEGADVVFHDIGANGANATSWMRNPNFPAQLARVHPELVILAWGINDAHMPTARFDADRFRAHYIEMIQTIRSATPGVEILLVTNNDSHYKRRHNPNAAAVRKVMMELVQSQRVACWDLFGHLGGRHSIDHLGRAGFAAADHLHMRRDGYVLMGELLYEVLCRAAFKTTAG